VSDSARRKTFASVRTAANGVANIAGLASGSRYVILSRKIGYAPTMSAPLALGDKDTLEADIELDKVVLLSDVTVKGKSNPQYTIDDRQLGKLPIDNLRLGEALRRYRRRMLGDNYKMCPPPAYAYVNGVRWPMHGAAFHPLGEIFASDILSVRYFDCWESDFPDLRNSIVIVLKPGVEFPAKNYGEAQREPTR
jgi:hypothetical protein